MSKSTQNGTAVPLMQTVVTDDYGIQVTGNPDWKQMRGDRSAEGNTSTVRPSSAVA